MGPLSEELKDIEALNMARNCIVICVDFDDEKDGNKICQK